MDIFSDIIIRRNVLVIAFGTKADFLYFFQIWLFLQTRYEQNRENMIDKYNPAGRLYAILSDAAQKNDKEETRKVWANVFGVEEGNETEVIRSLLSLHELVEEVHLLIKNNSQLNSELFLKSFPNLRRAVSAQNLSSQWNNYKIRLNPETMTRLEFCAEVLLIRTPKRRHRTRA